MNTTEQAGNTLPAKPAKHWFSYASGPAFCACHVCIWFTVWFLIVTNRNNEYWTGCEGEPGVNSGAPPSAAISLVAMAACSALWAL